MAVVTPKLVNNSDVKRLIKRLEQPREIIKMARQMDQMESQLAQALQELADIKQQLGMIPRPAQRQEYQQAAGQTARCIHKAQESFAAAKTAFLENTRKALGHAKEKGAAGLEKALNFMGVKDALIATQGRIDLAMQSAQKNADKLHALGSEYHAIGFHAKRLMNTLTGKENTGGIKANGKLNELLKAPFLAAKRSLEKAGDNVVSCLSVIDRIEQAAQRGRDKSVTSQLADFKPALQSPGRESRGIALERS